MQTWESRVADASLTDTATFVDDIFRVIRTKAYLPGAPAFKLLDASPAGGPLGQENAAYDPKAPVLLGNGHLGPAAGHRRKRSYNEQDGGSPGIDRRSPHGSSPSGERAFKQLRRGAPRGGRFDSFGGRAGRPGSLGPMQGQDRVAAPITGLPQPAMPGFPGMLPPGPPFPFDSNDPVAALMAMQAMGFPPLPGLPGVPPLPPPFPPAGFGPDPSTQTPPGPGSRPTNRNRGRCKDYDEKGFCALGGTCPFDHGADHMVVLGQGEGTCAFPFPPPSLLVARASLLTHGRIRSDQLGHRDGCQPIKLSWGQPTALQP